MTIDDEIHLTMKDLPDSERPYERMLQVGAAALSDAELLAIILRSGAPGRTALQLATRLLTGGDGLEVLREASLEELQQIEGIGKVKSIQIKAVAELGLRLAHTRRHNRSQPILSPKSAIAVLEPKLLHLPREEFHVLLLDIRSRLIRMQMISGGGLSAAVVFPRDIFREAVKANAASLILAHNHPSGDASPSQTDIDSTRRFVEIGTIMGLPVADHIIVAAGGSVSMKQLGVI